MKKLSIVICVFYTLFAAAAYAVKVPNLYQAEVPVSTQSAEARAEAVKEGFIQVLTKVSGDSEIIKNKTISESLEKADYFVQEFSYSTSTTSSSQYEIRIKYDVEDIKRLLRQSGINSWGQNRPLILVWLVVNDKQKENQIISSEDHNDILNALKLQSKNHGIPMIFPMMDVADVSHVNSEDITSMSIPLLQEAGKRYSPDGMLIGKIEMKNDEYASQWQLVIGKNQWDWVIADKTANNVIATVVNQVTQTLAKHFVKSASNDQLLWVNLEVNNVTERNDLGHLMRYLTQLSPVQQIRLSQVSGDMVELAVLVNSSFNSFEQNAAIGQHLVLKTHDEAANKIIYDWVH